MLHRSWLRQFDFSLLGGALVLSLIGLVGIYSATMQGADSSLYLKQAIWIVAGVVLCLVILAIDYRFLTDHAFVLYGITILVLIAVLIFGREINGSKSWIRFGGVGIQPSEPAKIIVILTLASYLADLNENYLRRKDVLILAGITLLPMLLITMQGDLGTALTFVPILVGTMLVAGFRWRFLAFVLVVVLCIAPLGWFTLKEHQQQRILVTLNPDLDPDGVGYQTRQSLIAIGSGGLTGKGLGNGLQSQLGFVPEIHSDFIYSLLSEEHGFLGGAVILALFLAGLLRIVSIGELASDRAGILIVTGVASLLCFHVSVNVGMTLGILPVIGIPLPLLSYGGSSTLSTFMALGLVLNVHFRRFLYGEARVGSLPAFPSRSYNL